MPYEIRLDVYQGPFDLLLNLIKRDKIDIYDIPIAKITDEFLNYLRRMTFPDIDLASDFLVVAATLMQIKARMLVPRYNGDGEEDEEDPRAELVDRLLEYRRFKEVAGLLRDKSEYWSHIFTRQADEIVAKSGEFVPDIGSVSVFDLAEAFLKMVQIHEEVEAASKPRLISRERYSIDRQIKMIRTVLSDRIRISFFDLFKDIYSRDYIITTFLATLELIKCKEIRAMQKGIFADIVLERMSKEGINSSVKH